MITTLEEFWKNYRIKNGDIPNETTLNRGQFRIKRELRELHSVAMILSGSELPQWQKDWSYEADEYVYFAGRNWVSTADGNTGNEPGKSSLWKEVLIPSVSSLASRMATLENEVTKIKNQISK